MKKPTTIWGVVADSSGVVQYRSDRSEKLPGGGLRVRRTESTFTEPAGAYAATHPAPVEMRWGHGEVIGRVRALRRSHGRLYAVAESDELEPGDLELLTEKHGDLRWSAATNNRRSEPLRITEISLTPAPASIGLPPVRWWKLDVTKGNLPAWVQDDLARARKTEHRSRHELLVHDVDYERNPYSDFDRYEREIGLPQGGQLENRTMKIGGERVPLEFRPATILSVGGRPVRRRV